MNELEKHFQEQAEAHERLLCAAPWSKAKPAIEGFAAIVRSNMEKNAKLDNPYKTLDKEDWVRRYNQVFEASGRPIPCDSRGFEAEQDVLALLDEIGALKRKVDDLENEAEYYRGLWEDSHLTK